MPRTFRALAIRPSEVAPDARISAIMGEVGDPGFRSPDAHGTADLAALLPKRPSWLGRPCL